MNVMLFGTTGMVGQGVLRQCLLDSEVESVLAVGRTPLGQSHPKLKELVHADLFDLAPVEERLVGYDACFFSIGVTSAGLDEEAYYRLTYELTLSLAGTLARLNPRMTFVYVSGAGADSSEQGRSMWARVRGKTENALLKLPFAAVFVLRPAMIQPLDGIRSKTRSYRMLYTLATPVTWLLKRSLPMYVTDTRRVGRAMLQVARHGADRQVLECADINALAAEAS
jgi:uncharacterized protein YbjT (DUF2867 family)